MGIFKRTTGLVGLAVAPNAHHTLGALYGKILRTIQKMPETSVYRKYTEQIVRERACAVAQTKDVVELEKAINCGQAEELIVQAENELNLARKMLIWKPWEPLMVKPPKGQWDWPPAKKQQHLGPVSRSYKLQFYNRGPGGGFLDFICKGAQ